MKKTHGGDIYRNHVTMDFSVNVNPLGIPEAVKTTLCQAVADCSTYPDIAAEKLKKSVSEMLRVPKNSLLFGNGASELFMAIVHGINPKRTVIVVPSFYGYEHAAEAATGEIVYYETKQGNKFCFEEDFYQVLTEKTDLLFLANPGNPTGNLMSSKTLVKLFSHCEDKGIFVVLDECFIEFCGQEFSMLQEIEKFRNLILVRAFTKIFAIPGVRLGYLVCSNQQMIKQINRQLPEWNLSTFAQAAGCECTLQTAFVKQTVEYIGMERKFLEAALTQAGFTVFSGSANFLLIYSEYPLYDGLLERGILIRDCENFRGLSKGFYRIAVKSREENEMLLQAIGEMKWKK